MQDHARVSVLIAVFNQQSFLGDALGSIQQQSVEDFDVVIIDDGSTDESGSVAAEFCKQDARFRLFRNKENFGLTHSLNRGLAEVRAPYIARMDADDIADPYRLELQLREFELDPNLVLCGSNVIYFDSDSNSCYPSFFPSNDEQIRVAMLLKNCFAHSSVMLRAKTLKSHSLKYDPSWDTAQDYRLWGQLLAYGSCRNLQAPLVQIRLHRLSVSSVRSTQQIIDERRAQQSYLRWFLHHDDPPPECQNLISGFLNICPEYLIEKKDLLLKCSQQIALLRFTKACRPVVDANSLEIATITTAMRAIVKKPRMMAQIYREVCELITTQVLISLTRMIVFKLMMSLRIGGLKSAYLSFFPKLR